MFQHRANVQTRDYIKFYRGKFQGNESRLVENEARRTRIPKQVKYPQRNFQRSVQLNDAPRWNPVLLAVSRIVTIPQLPTISIVFPITNIFNGIKLNLRAKRLVSSSFLSLSFSLQPLPSIDNGDMIR